MALPPLARLGTYLASGWEAGGPGSPGRYPLASHRVALSSLGGASIGRMVGQGGEKGPSFIREVVKAGIFRGPVLNAPPPQTYSEVEPGA